MRFAAWNERPQPRPRPVGVLDPAVDFGSLSDPKRLDKVGQQDAESGVLLRQSALLPQDDAFVSTFRRPLVQQRGDQTSSQGDEDVAKADPLGVAAPGINIEAFRAERSAQVALREKESDADRVRGLEQDEDFIIGGNVKFPKIPQTSMMPARKELTPRHAQIKPRPTPAITATRSLPPKLGRLRQARTEDLSDLLKPGAFSGSSEFAVGEVSHPRDDGPASSNIKGTWRSRPPRAEAEQREDRNSAIATQQLLHKRMKGNNREQYPERRQTSYSERRPSESKPRRSTTLDIGEY